MTRVPFLGATRRFDLAIRVMAAVLPIGLALGQQSKTYTTNADFDTGVLTNVNHVIADQLQLDVVPPSDEFSFVYIACGDRGTVVRINALTGEILGEYRTAPDPLGKSPSRTSVDDFGNVWVGNRAESSGGKGSVAKIGIVVGGTRVNANGTPNPVGQYLAPPYQYSTAVDRDGDGLIRTSRGLDNILSWPNITDGAGGANGIVEDAQDECILIYQRTTGIQVRAVAVDGNNDVWVGGYPFFPTAFDKLSGANGAILTTFSPDCGGNGALVDASGILWSESHLESSILRYNPSLLPATAICVPVVNSGGFPSLSHGIAVDNNGFIWVCQFNDNEVSKYDPAGNLVASFRVPSGGASLDRSIAVTPIDNNVWVANSGGNDVSRLANDGTLRKVIPLGATGISPRGLSVDASGKVWVSNFGSNNAMRIDPNAGADGLGAVDLTVDLGAGAAPENYSDFTGSVPLATLQPNGNWRVVFDSGSRSTEYGRISYHGAEPTGTSLVVEFRVANTVPALANVAFQPVTNGLLFDGVFGRFAEIRVRFLRATPQTIASPILFDLTIETLDDSPDDADCPPPGHPNPGSLLVYPEFDNRSGNATLITVTNSSQDHSFESPGIEGGTVDVEFVYLARRGLQGQLLDCIEFNRTHRLSPNDTFTALTGFHNPQASQGYVYAFAKDPATGAAIVHNFLIGSSLVANGAQTLDYSHNAFVYLGVGAEGTTTDDDGDGIRDLNGFEYCPSSDETLVPRFIGQRSGIASDLVLINLTGGPEFSARIDFAIYNDNEEAFSSQVIVQCWDKRPLLSISNVFSEQFLKFATHHAPNEVFGAPTVETGWFRMDGRVATSAAFSIQDPAFLALLIENAYGHAAAALPFETGEQDNGDLLPDGPFGDLSQ